ncbi:ribosomal protein S18-alanine N-acetyltransferase [Caldimonas tepidiphila]|uniref:ribosomal protein S18-alanine N-acetyltransferase n=1 Tax=Caldimonas tepidiphila TaxID=2315841 RepID=UPI000E5A9513|nr:ribosomal protein S18-alanine N-acetyltransferase [Caldimonas tepidiphila]
MSARLQPASSRIEPMREIDLGAVMRIENAAYGFPWSLGNFCDSLRSGYHGRLLLRDGDDALLGYFVAMSGVDEMHLLNITVAPEHQRQGHALRLLQALCELCRDCGAAQLWLEVRVSNERARQLYERFGFGRVGMRRAYYPAAGGQREDALVMSMEL